MATEAEEWVSARLAAAGRAGVETPELGAITELAGSLVIGGLKEQPDGSMQWEHGEVRNQARFDAKGAERPHEEQGRVAAGGAAGQAADAQGRRTRVLSW